MELALLDAAAEGRPLNPEQAALVRELAVSGARLQLALAPAGSGKTTALRTLARAWTDAGGNVLGLAPSAAAAAVLRAELHHGPAGGSDEAHADTLAKLVWHLHHPDRPAPAWIHAIGPNTLVIVDEAGMAGTRDLAAATSYVLDRGGSIRLVGDDRQLSAVPAGGALRDIARTHGAASLHQLVRFTDPHEAAATLQLRTGDHAALDYYLRTGRVHAGTADTAVSSAFTAWATDHDDGLDALMLAPTRDLAAHLNAQARARRLAFNTSTGPEADLADGNRASTGDVVITRRNRRDLPITSTDWVKNGDRFTVTAVHPDGALDARYYGTDHTVQLPADYVRDQVQLGYATTVHGAQGTTADVSHTVLTGNETRQLLYVAATRGRHANHLHLALPDTAGNPETLQRADALRPPSPRDVLARILDRDDTLTSASSTHQLSNPADQLRTAIARYTDTLHQAARDRLGQSATRSLEQRAERLHPGITGQTDWYVLIDRLALLAAEGAAPLPLLVRAATAADEPSAAALLIALDAICPLPTELTMQSPAVPAAFADDNVWGPVLAARAHQVRALQARKSGLGNSHPAPLHELWSGQVAALLDARSSAAITADAAWPAVLRALEQLDASGGDAAATLGRALERPLPNQAATLELLYRLRRLDPADLTPHPLPAWREARNDMPRIMPQTTNRTMKSPAR